MLFNYYFLSLKVVDRGSDTQLQGTENLCYFGHLDPNIYMYQCFKI